MKTILNYQVDARGNFSWPTSQDPLPHIIDKKSNRKLVGLSYRGKLSPRPGIKRIWVKRTDDGRILIAPGLHPEWEPLP